MPEFVFVYGSLKRGLHNHQLLRQANFHGEAITVSPDFRMGNVGDYPEITRTQSTSRGYIAGEVYQCPLSILHDLDQLEGNGEWYGREKILLRMTHLDHKVKQSPRPADCIRGWIYLWLKPPHPDVNPIRVENGFPVYSWSPSNEATFTKVEHSGEP